MAFVDKVGTFANQNKDKMFEDMDVDYVETSSKKNVEEEGCEEGEISGDGDTDVVFPVPEASSGVKKPERKFDNRAGGFITGIDVFGKEEQARLLERAKRFGLHSSNTHSLSEKELKKLYWSVGANEEDSDKTFRFDSLTMYGTEAMSTKDIFEYFSDYAPSSIEWLSDNSCNVIWLDNLSAVRALLGLSKPLKYPSSKSVKSSDKKKAPTDKEHENDIIMLDDNSGEESKSSEDFAAEIAADPEAIDLDELVGDVPSGRWRKGKTHPHSDSILLRFARRTNGSTATDQDGRPARLPQPVFGMVGLISSSRKERIKQGLLVRPKLFQDDMGDERDFVISSDEDDNRNPWGTLAKSWGHIDRARRPIASYDDVLGPYSTSPPPPALMLPRLPLPLPLPSILRRVGFRPPVQPISSRLSHAARHISRSPSLSPERPPAPRRRESRDYERRVAEKRKRTRDSTDRSSASESDSDEEWTKRVKVPRMRMYADEEEKRSKERSKVVNSRSESVFGRTDLRSRLQQDKTGHRRRTPPPSSSHRARSPYRREDYRRRNDRESARRFTRESSSVWLRLERQSSGVSSVVTRPEESDVEYDSTDYESRTSSSSESESDRVVVKSTVRYARQSDDDDDDDDDNERRSAYVSRSNGKSSEKVDLRSKLNRKKSASAPKPKARSPLRIEIDNDEYYRLIGADKE